jgi:hypothetical protein
MKKGLTSFEICYYISSQYCIEGIEMRQLAFRSADIYCQNITNLKCTFLYANGKKGKQANSERDRERESASV